MVLICAAQSAGIVEYTDCISAEVAGPPHNECPDNDTKQSDGGRSSNAGTLENLEYLFIAIAPWSSLARSGST